MNKKYLNIINPAGANIILHLPAIVFNEKCIFLIDCLDIEEEMYYVAVFNYIVLAL